MSMPDAHCCNDFWAHEARICMVQVMNTFKSAGIYRWNDQKANAAAILETCPQKKQIIIPLCCGGVVTIDREDLK